MNVLRARLTAWKMRARVAYGRHRMHATIGALIAILFLLPFAIANLPPRIELPTPDITKAVCDAPDPVKPATATPTPPPAPGSYQKIFGFAEFIAAFALLVVLYTITDAHYKFRLAVAPGILPLDGLTYALMIFIGFAALLTEVWWSDGWRLPRSCWITKNVWQFGLGALFFGATVTWMWYAFISPPSFGRRNARRFLSRLVHIMIRGNDQELAAIAYELARSAKGLVKYASLAYPLTPMQQSPLVARIAHDALLLMGDRKFCRHVVRSSPGTAARFFLELADYVHPTKALGAFAMNVSSEAISQRDSFLYHEERGYQSGWIGQVKYVTHAMFGNYDVLANMGHQNPLEIHYQDTYEWKAREWAAYCRVTLLAFESYVKKGTRQRHPHVIAGAVREIEFCLFEIAKAENYRGPYTSSEGFGRIDAVEKLINGGLSALASQPGEHPLAHLRQHGGLHDAYDLLAHLTYELIGHASRVEGDVDLLHSIHHNAIWGEIVIGHGQENDARRIFRARLFRLLRHDIRQLTEFPNYKGSRILGLVLNMVGITGNLTRNDYGREVFQFGRWVRYWTRRNFQALWTANSEVADSVMTGHLSYDPTTNRIAYATKQAMRREHTIRYMDLDGEGRPTVRDPV